MKKILVTCPPMLGLREEFIPYMNGLGYEAVCPEFTQVVPEDELCQLLPKVEGWIIGDDMASRKVIQAGVAGKFRAAVRWGIGVDNVDFDAFKEFGVPVVNTPNVFGREVADIAIGYLVALARHTFLINAEVKKGKWIKPIGSSLAEKNVGVVGYGDIGSNVVKRLLAADMNVTVWDPAVDGISLSNVNHRLWPSKLEEVDFLIFTCSLNKENHHMLGKQELARCKAGLKLVNVARGPLIDEKELIAAIDIGHVDSVALDVFEVEPLPLDSYFLTNERCILGSHNSSNTREAVSNTNRKAIDELVTFLT